MNIVNTPLDVDSDEFYDGLDRRVTTQDSSANIAIDITYDSSGMIHVVPVDKSQQPLDIRATQISRITFVLNMRYMAVEMVANIGSICSFLLYAPIRSVTQEDVQYSYNMCYDVADMHDKLSTQRRCAVLTLIERNPYFVTDDDEEQDEDVPSESVPMTNVGTQATQQASVSSVATPQAQANGTLWSDANGIAYQSDMPTNKAAVPQSASTSPEQTSAGDIGSTTIGTTGTFSEIPDDILQLLLANSAGMATQPQSNETNGGRDAGMTTMTNWNVKEGSTERNSNMTGNNVRQPAYDDINPYAYNLDFGFGAESGSDDIDDNHYGTAHGNAKSTPARTDSTFDVDAFSSSFNQLLQQMNQAAETAAADKQRQMSDKLVRYQVANAKLDKQVTALRDENTKLSQRINGYNAQITSLKDTHAAELADKDKEIEDVRDALSSAMDARDSVKEELERQKDEAEKEREKLNETIADVREKLNTEQRRSTRQSKELESYKSKLNKSNGQVSALNDKVATLSAERDKAITDAENARKDANAKAQEAIGKAQAQAKDAIAQAQTKANDAIAEEREKVKKQASDFKSVADNLMQRVKQQQQDYKDNIADKDEQITDLKQQLESMTDDRDSIRKQLGIMSRTNASAKGNISSITRQLDRANASIKDRDSRITQLREQLDAAIANADEVKADADRKTSVAQAKYEEATGILVECDALMDAIHTIINRDDLTIDMEAMNQKLEAISDAIATARETGMPADFAEIANDGVTASAVPDGTYETPVGHVSVEDAVDADAVTGEPVVTELQDDGDTDFSFSNDDSIMIAMRSLVDSDDAMTDGLPDDDMLATDATDNVDADTIDDDALVGTPLETADSIDTDDELVDVDDDDFELETPKVVPAVSA